MMIRCDIPSLADEHFHFEYLRESVAHGLSFSPVLINARDELADISLKHVNLPDFVEQGQFGNLSHLREILLQPAVEVVQFPGFRISGSYESVVDVIVSGK